MRDTPFRLCIAAATLLSMACGQAPSPSTDESLDVVGAATLPARDSAGVRIIEWEGEPEAVATLQVEHLYTHGQGPDDYTFGQFGPSALLDDGRAVVADLMNRELLVFSADGSDVTVLARGGESPDALGALRGLWTTGGDTIWFQDGTNPRFARFVADTLDAVWSTEDRPSISLGLRTVGADRTGAVMLTTSAFSPRFETPWLPGHMVRLDLATNELDTVATYDLAPRSTPGQADPFSPFGEVTVADGRWVQTRSDQARLTWLESDGRVVQILRWNPEPNMPVEQDWLDFVATIENNIRRNNKPEDSFPVPASRCPTSSRRWAIRRVESGSPNTCLIDSIPAGTDWWLPTGPGSVRSSFHRARSSWTPGATACSAESPTNRARSPSSSIGSKSSRSEASDPELVCSRGLYRFRGSPIEISGEPGGRGR